MEKLWGVCCEHLGIHPLSFTGPHYKSPSNFDVADWYLWQMGDKTIPDKAPPSLKSFYPPFVTGINLLQSRCCGFFVSFTNKDIS